MSEKVNKAIEVTYQAAGSTTGLDDVKMEVYDEGHALDVAKGVAAMTEIGSTGRYYATFTPDAEGEWQVHIDSVTTSGKVVKHYTIVAHDVDSVGDAVAGLNDIDAAGVNAEVDTALTDYDAATGAEVAALENLSSSDVQAELTSYDAATGTEVATVDGKIDALNDIDAAAVAGELATYDAPTKAELDSGLAALNDIDAAGVNSEVDTALADYDVAKASDITAPPMVG